MDFPRHVLKLSIVMFEYSFSTLIKLVYYQMFTKMCSFLQFKVMAHRKINISYFVLENE